MRDLADGRTFAQGKDLKNVLDLLDLLKTVELWE